ncbi:MAG: MBL fold metallo-hydrolase [Candidatus Kapabacteria bacterium]|nr:MBL fold metallo-hydrolase [Candidatus Kapabacteria bacterium]
MRYFKWSLVIVIILLITLYLPQFGQKPEGFNKEKIMKSKNHFEDKFQNTGGIKPNMTPIKMLPLIPKFLSNDSERIPSWTIPVLKRNKREFEGLNDSLIRITWFGHSTFMLEIDGKRIMMDPVFGQSVSPISCFVRRFNENLPLEIEDLPQIDAVIISHDHFDHLDKEAIIQLKDKVKKIFVPLGVGSHLIDWGVAAENISESDWWEEVHFNELTITCTPSQHFSGRGLTDRNNTLWCSWVITGKSRKVFFSGDSGYFKGFKEIGEKYGPFDVCMMECGQYDELWHEIHMYPEETVKAFKDLKGKVLIPMHWGSFSLSLHKWNEPVKRLIKAAALEKIIIATPMIGESIVYPGEIPQLKWWSRNYVDPILFN